MKISVALKAKIRKNWSDVSREIYVRWRFNGSRAMWLWLARIINGRSQQDRTSKGVDKGSVAISGLISDQPVSELFINQWRLISAMIRLWPRDEGHNHLGRDSQIVGNSIRVGRRTFSIGEGSGFAGGRCRACGLLLPVGPVLH